MEHGFEANGADDYPGWTEHGQPVKVDRFSRLDQVSNLAGSESPWYPGRNDAPYHDNPNDLAQIRCDNMSWDMSPNQGSASPSTCGGSPSEAGGQGDFSTMPVDTDGFVGTGAEQQSSSPNRLSTMSNAGSFQENEQQEHGYDSDQTLTTELDQGVQQRTDQAGFSPLHAYEPNRNHLDNRGYGDEDDNPTQGFNAVDEYLEDQDTAQLRLLHNAGDTRKSRRDSKRRARKSIHAVGSSSGLWRGQTEAL